MPQFTPEQADALDEAMDRQVFRISKVFKSFFGTEMSDDELRRTKRNMQQGVQNLMESPQDSVQTLNRRTVGPVEGMPGMLGTDTGVPLNFNLIGPANRFPLQNPPQET